MIEVDSHFLEAESAAKLKRLIISVGADKTGSVRQCVMCLHFVVVVIISASGNGDGGGARLPFPSAHSSGVHFYGTAPPRFLPLLRAASSRRGV